MTASTAPSPHVIDVVAEHFEADVLQYSLQVPVLIDFWATWCGPCKALGPILEKLADEYAGAFRLAKVDVDAQQELAAAFQIRSVPTVFLLKGGQIVDGFPGALPEGQLREFLTHHGVVPGAPAEATPEAEEAPAVDPQAEVARLRAEVEADPEKAELRLELALALLQTGAAAEAEQLLDGLPANLSTDDRAVRARARLEFAARLAGAPSPDALAARVQADPADLEALHLLGVHHLVAGRSEQALDAFLEMLRRDKAFGDGLARRTLIDAFKVIEDEDLVGTYRRRMASLLLV